MTMVGRVPLWVFGGQTLCNGTSGVCIDSLMDYVQQASVDTIDGLAQLVFQLAPIQKITR